VRRHAKAATAGSTEGKGRGLFRLPFAIRGASSEFAGNGASPLARSLALLALATAFLLTASAPAAIAAVQATPAYVKAGQIYFGPSKEPVPGSPEGQIITPGQLGLAVEPVTGNVLVAEPVRSKIEVFAPDQVQAIVPGPETPAAPVLTSIDTSPGAPSGIAIDQSSGDVYVSETGSDKIVRYLSDGAATPTYTLDPSFVSPAKGAAVGAVGSFNSALAVDPVSHDLLVADSGNNRVSRYSASGAFLSAFDGSDTGGGAFTGLLSIAVGPTGAIYVNDSSGTIAYGGSGRVERFSSAGTSLGALGSLDTPRSVAVDQSSGNVLVGGRSGYPSTPLLYVFAGGTTPVGELEFPQAESQAVSLAVAEGGSQRLYGLTDRDFGLPSGGGNGVTAVQAFDRTTIPGVEIGPPTEVGQDTAHLSGKVNPGGQKTSAHFEYLLEGSSSWVSTPSQEVGEGSGEQSVTADLAGLRPSSAYSVRLYAENSHLNGISGIETFTTQAKPPTVSEQSAGEVTPTSATLHGKVLANGLQTTYHFEYGLTAGYGSRIPGHELAAGSGHQALPVSIPVTGLQPGAEYHYRLVATNSAGTAAGDDMVLTTGVASGPSRGYEMVSPVEKQGTPADSHFTGAYARPDGNGIVYATEKSGLPQAEGNPLIPRVLAMRSADNWTNTALDAPTDILIPNDEFFFGTPAVSRDLSAAVLLSQHKFTPDAVQGTWNAYLRHPAADPLSAENLTLMASDNRLGILAGSVGNYHQIGTSDDGRTLVFNDNSNIVYEVSVGMGLRLVSELPDGSVTTSAVRTDAHDPHVVSADGSRIFFGENEGLYVREDGTTSVPISVSHRPGDPVTPVPANFLGASADGRYVVFQSTAQLTEDASSGGGIYRYDLDTDTMTYTAPALPYPRGPEQRRTLDVVPETGEIYYVLDTDLFRGHDGTATLIAALDTKGVPASTVRVESSLLSPNGRYFAFTTTAPLGSYETEGGSVCHTLRNEGSSLPLDSNRCLELYVFEVPTKAEEEEAAENGEPAPEGKITCVSCRTDGLLSTGDVHTGISGGSSFNLLFPRMVLDDGTVIFDTPDPLVRRDSNGTRDVYSYKDGQATLITPGVREFNATFIEATPSGHDIYFTTAQQLVGQDRDNTADLYDARVDGGLASQNPPPPVECLRDDCKATPNAGPELPFGGSEGLTGPGNVGAPVKKRCGKGRHGAKVRGKTRCVKQNRKRANTNRRQGR
jgi:sugar lactone lactonase YvrE